MVFSLFTKGVKKKLKKKVQDTIKETVNEIKKEIKEEPLLGVELGTVAAGMPVLETVRMLNKEKEKKEAPKKITPAKQKAINKAAPVIKKITKGYKKGSPVKFAPKPEKPIKPKAHGGMTHQGLYPAEEARSGTMSQTKRKKYMKKGGVITYRMTGGQVVDAGYD